MRQIGGYLEELLKPFSCHLIAHEGKRNGKREGNQYTVQADYQGILNCYPELVGIKILSEVFQSCPAASHNPLGWGKILKGNGHTVHRYIGKEKHNYQRGEHEQIQGTAPFQPLSETDRLCNVYCCFLSCHSFHHSQLNSELFVLLFFYFLIPFYLFEFLHKQLFLFMDILYILNNQISINSKFIS